MCLVSVASQGMRPLPESPKRGLRVDEILVSTKFAVAHMSSTALYLLPLFKMQVSFPFLSTTQNLLLVTQNSSRVQSLLSYRVAPRLLSSTEFRQEAKRYRWDFGEIN
ncbi:hypothetical protein SOMG_02554 [Schizosaccharomyces osmophilus]|uniref:Uncharacterized protein n=1 Tax=Schizosaccharomyces osmophilus TaxID=2545709 RepID=A0AAE9WG62_9SCHI|nr:uncharacterized protein SOMG_02554 [Schizosaccharomyces osmophilus]WBW74481.1 hypothetical protein SOMG_02554 [Schizosaccharomyces osmophilus]